MLVTFSVNLYRLLQLLPEEEERRRVRRERNKEAAAKCRQKRVDLTNQLMSVMNPQVCDAEIGFVLAYLISSVRLHPFSVDPCSCVRSSDFTEYSS